ncbi:peptidase S8 and S53 [Capsaspora owczarzaki ATCC 30864]|nr:peptidase S8 and S53 [Capsaspora owczarzaki ATCC 30864]|eukprot:XP_004363407.1 peptidase S8 and S53 [Capsaspora owczarzaki ATCC 30864]
MHNAAIGRYARDAGDEGSRAGPPPTHGLNEPAGAGPRFFSRGSGQKNAGSGGADAGDTPGDASNPGQAGSDSNKKPTVVRRGDEGIPQQYIIMFRASADERAKQAVRDLLRSTPGVEYLRDFSATGGLVARFDDDMLKQLMTMPAIDLIEQDGKMHIHATTAAGNSKHISGRRQNQPLPQIPTEMYQVNAPWNLDRIDQRALPLDGFYKYHFDGAGIHVYVIDTGIRTTHEQFQGRIGNGVCTIDGIFSVQDCNGHGTHVAGTVAGKTYGVAKNVTVHPVRVLGCDGEGAISDVIEGVAWVTANAIPPAVAVMSLGGTISISLDTAVSAAVASGVTVSVAAGNENEDACNSSPARNEFVVSVGATDLKDFRATFSNYGPCVSLFAPGVDITSAWWLSDTDTRTISGTSMAAPLVAGMAARLLQFDPGFTPDMIKSILSCAGTKGIVEDAEASSPNILSFFAIDQPTQIQQTTDNTPATQCGDLSTGNDTTPNANGCYVFTGTINLTTISVASPSPYYQSDRPGTLRGYLSLGNSANPNPDLDPSTDFLDLGLYKFNQASNNWDLITSSTTVGNDEQIVYFGTAGYYTFQIAAAPAWLRDDKDTPIPYMFVFKPPSASGDSPSDQCNQEGSAAATTMPMNRLLGASALAATGLGYCLRNMA